MINSYWEYAGTRYKNKFRAIDAANGDYKRITFHAYEEPSFTNYSWTVEPKTPLRQLMKDRALQLRDKHRYIKLWFSGGNDSTTMLNIFLENNIHIDEICVYRMSSNNDFKGNGGEYEINTYTLPYLKKIQHTIPKTKIKIIEIGQEYFDDVLGEKWLFTRNSFDLRETYIPNIKGKNFCNLFANLDPFVVCRHGKWYWELWDTDNIKDITSYRNIEHFYTSSDMPELHAKQCHIIKNFLVYNKLFNANFGLVKEILRNIVRDTPIAPEPSWLAKEDFNRTNMFFVKKSHLQYKQSTPEQKDKIKYLFTNAKVNGVILPNVMNNYRAKSVYLGDS